MSLTNNKIELEKLETHVVDGCNLKCHSCSHYSNFLKGGLVSIEQYRNYVYPWGQYLKPKEFNILGGEPLINPNLDEMIYITRETFPDTDIKLITNGLLTEKIKHLEKIKQSLIDTKSRIIMSFHSMSQDYRLKIKPVVDMLKNWSQENGIRVIFKDCVTIWTERYRVNDSGKIIPFYDNDPKSSFDICNCKQCTFIRKGYIYKCAPIGMLSEMSDKALTHEDFDEYLLSYKPIHHTDGIDKITDFFKKNFAPESICGMCPAFERKIRNKSIH